PNDEWLLAQSRLEKALRLNPGDPGVAEDLGRLHEIRARGAPSAVSKAELQRALGYFKISAAARPTSPYTWANIAFAQSRLGVIDADFYRAIDNAALLGPWEPEVQLTLADIGFRYWDRMPKSARATIHQA